MEKESVLNTRNVLNIFKMQLKQRWKILLIVAAILVGCMVMYLAMFPIIKIMFEQMQTDIDIPGLAESMKMITDPNAYFASILQSLAMGLLAFAAYSGASIFASEESRGTTEYLYSLPVNRSEVYVGKMTFSVATMLFLNVAVMIFSIIVMAVIGAIGGETVKFGAIVLSFVFLFLASLIFTAIGAMLSNVTKKGFKSAPVAIGIYFGTYIISFLASFGIKELQFLKYFSPTDFLGAMSVMNSSIGIGSGSINIAVYILTPILIIVPIIIGFIFYRKKDIA